jgi:hypothetical protein
MTKTPEELTEDWKAGELEYGRYWVKNKVWEKPFIDRWLPNCSWKISCKDAIEQILAPVPTYDEYKAMQAELAEFKEKVADQRTDLESARWYQTVQNEDISKLRALLKGCQEVLSNICEENDWNSEYSTPLDVWDIMIRINEVLK